MKKYTVRLQEGTVGTIVAHIPSDAYMEEGVLYLLGIYVTVQLKDENGRSIKKTGTVCEVLSEEQYDLL